MKKYVTIYDAFFIALAKRIRAELATADKRQASAGEKPGLESGYSSS